MIWLEYEFKTKGTWLYNVFLKKKQVKKCDIIKCMSQYLRIMSLKMRWPWIWATFGIQTPCRGPALSFLSQLPAFPNSNAAFSRRSSLVPSFSKMGISSETSRKLIFAPYCYSGFAFADTWVHQGIQHLQLLIGHLCHQDQVGNLLQINIDTLQLLLSHSFPPPYLTLIRI